ncbi:MAG TPA: DNA primase [Bryobacteraceae bacterium]|nr:DNA primase [Bryobacteraceae bacterium]
MEFVEQLKSSIDIVDVVGQYVRLRKAGPTRWVGLCPFHTEKTPSFGVHAVHQFYKCFGCGAGGDAIKFVMEIEALTFYEALKLLSERYGIPMPRRSEYSDPETKLRAALYRMHEMAQQIYQHALASPAGADARAYLAKRGLTPALIEEFGLGFAERSGQRLVRAFEKEGFTREQMEESCLVLRRTEGEGSYDRFRGRLMFPIQDESGKVIAFGGRALGAGEEPKYLNSAESESGRSLYKKTRVLYNLHRAKTAIRSADRAVLVEGYMDVIGVWAAGVKEVVASCGTSLTVPQVRAIKRHSEKIVVNFDSDAAGVNATEKYIQTLVEEGMSVRVLELEGGLDPDEYCKAHGADVYRQHVDRAPGYFLWLADRARSKYDMRTSEGRIAGLKFLLPAIQRISDKLERATVANDVANYLGVEAGLVLEYFRKSAVERRDQALPAQREPVHIVEAMLLHAVLDSAELRPRVIERLRHAPGFEEFATRRIFQAIFAIEDSGGTLRVPDLAARLEEKDQQLLSELLFADRTEEEAESIGERVEACLAALEKSGREAQRAALKAKIKEAERAGMLGEALRFVEELNRLERA